VIGYTCMLLCGFPACAFRAADRGCEVSTRPSLRPLGFEGGVTRQSSGEMRREGAKTRLRPHARCHRPAWPGDPVFRDSYDWAEKPQRTGFPAFAGNDSGAGRTKPPPHTPSLRAQRSNPASYRGGILDCFAALAM